MSPPSLLRRIRAWLNLEWVFVDDFGRSISEVVPWLYLGSKPTLDSLGELRDRRITHVVSSVQDQYRSDLDFLRSEFDHLFLAMHDDLDQELQAGVHEFIDYALAVREDPEAKILVHCEAGVSRSASLVIALLMKTEQLRFLDAYERVRSKRIRALPNIGFASQLQRLEHEWLPETTAASPSSLATYLKRYCAAPGEIPELQSALEQHTFDAPAALRSMYGGEIPRVVLGAR